MKRISALLMMVAFSVAAMAPVTAGAAEKKVRSEVVMKMGSKVHLFHSGTADVKKEICLNDIIKVYREGSPKNPSDREVGQIKVLGYAGEHYFEGEVVRGEMKPGDIAKKTSASCLVQPPRQLPWISYSSWSGSKALRTSLNPVKLCIL